jgi:pimeloyl-ACP methyl ester carboxylesterase
MSTTTITSIRRLGELKVQLLEAGQQGMPELLLIHGGLGDAHLHWHKTMSALGESFHMYAPDLPGFHYVSDALQKPSMPHLVQWMNDLLRDLNVEKVFLIGTSLGALLARFYAAHYPDVVEGLVLVDGGGITHLPRMVRVLIHAPGISHIFYRYRYHHIYSRRALRQALYQQALLTEYNVQTLTRASIGFMSVFRAMLAEPWPAQQTPICPTLVIWGQEDHLASPDEGRRLLHEIPQAELVLVEKAGHMPMLEQPDVFNAAVAAFFKKGMLESKVAHDEDRTDHPDRTYCASGTIADETRC